MLDVALYLTPRIVRRQRRSRPDALSFEGFVPALYLPVGLGCQLQRISTVPTVPLKSFTHTIR